MRSLLAGFSLCLFLPSLAVCGQVTGTCERPFEVTFRPRGELRMHLRSGASWALGPVTGSPTQKSYWQEIHELQASIFRRGVAAGEFVDEDPAYLAKLFSAMDQVLLADWVAGGMRTDRDALVRRLCDLIDRALCLPASSKRRTAAR